MNHVYSLLSCVLMALFLPAASAGGPGRPITNVIPRPRTVKAAGPILPLGKDGEVRAAFVGVSAEDAGAVERGRCLVEARLEELGARCRVVEKQAGADLVVRQVDDHKLRRLLKGLGASEAVESDRLRQAYVIRSRADGGQVRVTVTGCCQRGLFYGLVSLCQLVDESDDDGPIVPTLILADYPEIARRLAKTSGTRNPVNKVFRYASWLPLFKISMMGIQFHGENSRRPDQNFTENVRTLCPLARECGTLETVVYFCPFRGRGYDVSTERGREQYVAYVRELLRLGAYGIEIDYNDWPDTTVSPDKVISEVCEGIRSDYPQACVLYCPPNRGEHTYRGPATGEMARVLANVPDRVWPLWTGMGTLIPESGLKAEQARAWTEKAGRRPFLWVNRVAPDVPRSFSRSAPGGVDLRVFRGDLLPTELNLFFEGVHLNAGIGRGYNRLSGEFSDEAMAYLATASDYLWNPHQWNAAESARRAVHFVRVMRPLVEEASPLK